mmetsp:Transcript_21858/g.31354  ORF Transcript_21858/g.31354 Transcript_21858/m.31354 type:complete len:192 (+) Transcript_21858:248-823(+)
MQYTHYSPQRTGSCFDTKCRKQVFDLEGIDCSHNTDMVQKNSDSSLIDCKGYCIDSLVDCMHFGYKSYNPPAPKNSHCHFGNKIHIAVWVCCKYFQYTYCTPLQRKNKLQADSHKESHIEVESTDFGRRRRILQWRLHIGCRSDKRIHILELGSADIDYSHKIGMVQKNSDNTNPDYRDGCIEIHFESMHY